MSKSRASRIKAPRQVRRTQRASDAETNAQLQASMQQMQERFEAASAGAKFTAPITGTR